MPTAAIAYGLIYASLSWPHHPLFRGFFEQPTAHGANLRTTVELRAIAAIAAIARLQRETTSVAPWIKRPTPS